MNAVELERYRQRLYNRIPLIGGWLQRRTADALRRDGSPEAMQVLVEAVADGIDESARNAALQALMGYTFSGSVRALAEIITRSDDALVRDTILDTLRQLTGWRTNAICEVWAVTRHPTLDALLVEQKWVASDPPEVKVLTALKVGRLDVVTNEGQDIVRPLIQACKDTDEVIAERARRALRYLSNASAQIALCRLVVHKSAHGGDEQVRNSALQALRQVTEPGFIDVICGVWAATRHTDLAALLAEGGWIATSSSDLLVLTALKAGRLELVTSGGANVVELLLQVCEDDDPVIAERARQALGELQDVRAQEALCRLVVDDANILAREIAIAVGYAPEDEQQRALFFFLTEQWERYDLLDFDRQFLRAVYATADESLRQRIREKLRVSGRADFLTIVAGDDYQDRAAEMSESELALLVQTLIANQRWSELWDLVPEVAVDRSIRIVHALTDSGWRPENVDDRRTFDELASFIAQGLAIGGETDSFLPMLLRAQIRVPGRANDVAFAPDRSVIAIGTGRRKIVLWNYERAERERVLGAFEHSIGNVAFTGEGTLLCAERTNRTTIPCAIYGWDGDGQQFRLGQHVGSVTAVEPVGTSQVFSAGRDGQIVLWDVMGRREVAKQRLNQQMTIYAQGDWARAIAVSPNAQQVVLLGKRLEMMKLPQLEDLRLWSSSWAARSAVFSPTGKSLLVGQARGDVIEYSPELGTIERYNWPERRVQREERLSLVKIAEITHHEARVEEVAILPERSIIVSAAIDGSIQFTTLEDYSEMASVTVPSGRITSLHVSPDESFMAVGHSEETFSLWDLRGLQAYVILDRPLALAPASVLSALGVVAGFDDLPNNIRLALRYAECVLQHRFRYDIELGAVPTIMAGEFDIEID